MEGYSPLLSIYLILSIMFGTLRCSALEDDTEFVGRSYDPLMGSKDGIRYVACDRCRSKKVCQDMVKLYIMPWSLPYVFALLVKMQRSKWRL